MSENDESQKKEQTPVSQSETQIEETGKSKKHKMSKKKKAGITVGIILVFLACLAGAIYYFGHHYYAKTNYVTDEEATRQIEEQKAQQEAAEAEAGETEQVEEVIDPELLEAQQNMQQYASSEPITTDGNVYNVLLIGLDTTKENYVGNSDSMILISINYRLHQISMISLMRDTLVHIPDVGYRKLNAAYPNGGGPLLAATVEENYKIDVDRYATVDFGSMIDIVDEIGSIQLTFTEKEAENANKSIRQQCRILGLKSKDYLIPGEGTYTCNGMQAVAYARIRKVGNSDYQRTQRQREVLMKLLENVKAMSFEDIDRLATRLLPLVTHNVPENEFWGLLAKVPTLLNYNIVQDRIPYDGMYSGVNGNLVPEWESTARKLKETIYGADIIDDAGELITPTPTGEAAVTGEAVDGTQQTTDAAGTDGTDQTASQTTDQAAADQEVQGGEAQVVLEPEIGYNDNSAKMVVGENIDESVVSSFQAKRKAAVVADNVPGNSTASSLDTTQSGTQKKQKVIRNPYIDPVFVLRVPNAPAEQNRNLVDGTYKWRKEIVSTGIAVN